MRCVAVGPPAAAPRLALGRRHARQGPHRHRAVDVRLRRLPAVGHRARVRPGPGPPRRRVRASCWPAAPATTSTTTTTTRRRPTPDDPVVDDAPTDDRRRRSRADDGTGRPAIDRCRRSPRATSMAPHRDPLDRARRQGRVRACSRPTSRTGPATTRTRPMPGQLGNSAIAGHRTTYGAAVLPTSTSSTPGDEIVVTTVHGPLRVPHDGNEIVGADRRPRSSPPPTRRRHA